MQIDIFIKSFNRPHYLDRCLSSIYQYVIGDFNVKILDGGTPEKYLKKIKEKYPKVNLILSEDYHEKQKAVQKNIAENLPINGFLIPTKLWIDSAKNASNYFIMTEEDVWFTKPVQINQLAEEAKKHNISLIKLGWLGNKSDDNNLNIKSISNTFDTATPKKLLLFPKVLMTWFFYNRFKFFTILYKLKVVDNHTQKQYWALNSILMGFYEKKYWLEIWSGMQGKVDEKKQLINAASFYKKHKKNPNFIARLKDEALKTTFQSSATNSYHEYGFDFDVNHFNFILNEAWFSDQFDAMENYPKDFSEAYILSFLEDKTSLKIKGEEWKKWAKTFRKQYENLGCDVE